MKFRIFEDPDFEPELSLVFVKDERIVSFIIATQPKNFPPNEKNQATAWLKILATSKLYRKQGIGTILFDQIEAILKKKGVKEIRFSDRGNWHFWPGIDLTYEQGVRFLASKGFKKVKEEVDYVYALDHFYYPERVSRLKQELVTEGVNFHKAQKDERRGLIEWINKHFSPYWSSETDYAFRNDPPSVVVADEIMSPPSRRRTDDGSRRKILGFATIDGVIRGRFGPTGVDPIQQGRGIGTVLLFEAFQALKDEGLYQATVHWTDHLFFYTQVPGLCGVRHYWIMSKKI